MFPSLANNLTEAGLLPDTVIRHGIKRLLRQRLDEIESNNIEASAEQMFLHLQQMEQSAVAELPQKANEQHYEVPAAYFQQCLGDELKYSCAYWEEGVDSLHAAEVAALQQTCKRAGLGNEQRILELGCGWGSLTLWMAKHYPQSQITAVSNSHSQGDFIRQRATELGYSNVEIITADMNDYHTSEKFDRIVSVEMFEHMRNWHSLFSRINTWLVEDGKFFMHIFVHRNTPYFFEDKDASDWMSRYFFSGGMMPSADLPLMFQNKLELEERWFWNGQHYAKTCNAWLARMDQNKQALWPLFESTYGKDFAAVWWHRWRVFHLACAELFAFENGQEWFVGHYLFNKQDTE